jgi:hypothetical protein
MILTNVPNSDLFKIYWGTPKAIFEEDHVFSANYEKIMLRKWVAATIIAEKIFVQA